ncbi:MAG: hypothetical protein RIQ41_192 [Candidatus Parcubacteria bacterium]
MTTLPIFGQLSWYTIGQVCVQGFSFFGVIVTSRYLGPVNVGLYSFVQNYLLAFMTITIGMDFYFTWKVAKSDNQIRDVKEYFGHKVNVTAILSLVGIVFAWSILPRDVAQMATVMFAPLVLTSCMAFYQYAVASGRAKIIATVQVVSALVLFCAKVALVYVQAPLLAFVVVSTIDTVIVGVLLAVLFLSHKKIRFDFLAGVYPNLLKTAQFMYSIRMSIIAIALWQLILRIDQLVLATFENAYTLGIYAAAVKIAEVPNFLAGTLYTALVTHVAVFADKDDDRSKYKTQQVLILYASVGIMIACAVIILAPFAIDILYGSKFLDSVSVLRAYALSIPGMFVTLHYFAIYGARERHAFQSFVFVVGLVLNIVLIYALTPIFGLTGAALGTSIAYTFVAITFYIRAR